ncbi:uncharacterized protein PHALS_01390 [Plasmopara halstedii]|uniref:Uncharacterized protein n=1 Tax=Plasmopara halstedii TaxID=4781 RepID=A0A0P1ASK2_PLAHL|nr:uncharacterized protein PHALS_01390 [Plasmopara halstedii]CEG45063.1 hypothetical protein PHALS_01390 [Plasmopara halstedii]|eukprot:XP_024581432.1 hypothetical protein PHALS_01390 [Plasmopara halstedii]
MEDITGDDRTEDMEVDPPRPESTIIPTRTAISVPERGGQETTNRLQSVLLPRDAISDAERQRAHPSIPTTTPPQFIVQLWQRSNCVMIIISCLVMVISV